MVQSLAEMGRRGRESAEAQQEKSGKVAKTTTGSHLSSGPRAAAERLRKFNASRPRRKPYTMKEFRAHEIQGERLASRRAKKASQATDTVEE